MNKTEYLRQVIGLLVEKTKAKKISWSETSDYINSDVVGDLSAKFHMDRADAYSAEWDRFIIYQGAQNLTQVFNTKKYANTQDDLQRAFSTQLDDLFNYLALEPRQRRLQKSLDTLLKL